MHNQFDAGVTQTSKRTKQIIGRNGMIHEYRTIATIDRKNPAEASTELRRSVGTPPCVPASRKYSNALLILDGNIAVPIPVSVMELNSRLIVAVLVVPLLIDAVSRAPVPHVFHDSHLVIPASMQLAPVSGSMR
jgi:hypothetical protein